VESYLHIRALLDEAMHLLDGLGETLIAAHVATPIALLTDRLDSFDNADGAPPRRPT
jgi:hypothetical protein